MLLVFALASREVVASVVVAPDGMQTIATFMAPVRAGIDRSRHAMAFPAILITTLLPLLLLGMLRRSGLVAE
ncbi:iron(III) transport system permease protein [Rhizobium tibeticum]|nr:iron(III) transport system permease protein [Rhizobium tibeticum]